MNTITTTSATTKKIYRPSRPSRFQKWTAGFEVTSQAMRLGNALRAVRDVEEQFVDIAADVQEGAVYSTNAFNHVNARYVGAQRKLREIQRKAGLR